MANTSFISVAPQVAAVQAVVNATGIVVADIHDTDLPLIPTAESLVSLASITTSGVIVEDGATGTPNTTEIISGAATDTFGAWIQIDAAVSADSEIQSFSIHYDPVVNVRDVLLEIGTGAGGSELTKGRFSIHTRSRTEQVVLVFTLAIPIKVASGVRIAARSSQSFGAAAVSIWTGVQMYQGLET